MRITPSSTSSEHWLTLMNCTVCAHTPDTSPVYKCNLGHKICYRCFQNLISNGIPTCSVCDSDKFTRQDVSKEFLKKLRVKPGIGRPRRYNNYRSDCYGDNVNFNMSEVVTVEKLFQLPTSTIQQLFDESTKEKLRYLNAYAPKGMASKMSLKNEIRDEEICASNALPDQNSKLWLKRYNSSDSKTLLTLENNINPLQSRKPLKCPHDPCNKIIAVSSFQSHFKYEHCDFQRYNLDRGKELLMDFDPKVIEHERSICLGMVRLQEATSKATKLTLKKEPSKVDVDTFWIMVSASPQDKNSYAIFWLFTNNEEYYNATLELSSHQDLMTITTFCGVNSINESQNTQEVVQRLNCLFLTRSTIRSMLHYGPTLKLRICIH